MKHHHHPCVQYIHHVYIQYNGLKTQLNASSFHYEELGIYLDTFLHIPLESDMCYPLNNHHKQPTPNLGMFGLKEIESHH